MKSKGLCTTCNEDNTCVFPRRFPVLDCEEFNDYTNHLYVAKPKSKRAHYSQDVTEAE